MQPSPSPSQEMMYVWNGFTVVGRRPELTERVLATLEKAEEELGDDSSKRNANSFQVVAEMVLNVGSNAILTSIYLMSRPIRVSPGWPVCGPAAERPVSETSWPPCPGWALLQLCHFLVRSFSHKTMTHKHYFIILEKKIQLNPVLKKAKCLSWGLWRS